MCLHFLVYFDEGFGEMGLHQHKSKLGPVPAFFAFQNEFFMHIMQFYPSFADCGAHIASKVHKFAWYILVSLWEMPSCNLRNPDYNKNMQ